MALSGSSGQARIFRIREKGDLVRTASSMPATPEISASGCAFQGCTEGRGDFKKFILRIAYRSNSLDASRSWREFLTQLWRLELLGRQFREQQSVWLAASFRLRRFPAEPITARTVNSDTAERGTKIRCTLPRVSGGFRKTPSARTWVRSFGIRPSSISASRKRRRTHSPSTRDGW